MGADAATHHNETKRCVLAIPLLVRVFGGRREKKESLGRLIWRLEMYTRSPP